MERYYDFQIGRRTVEEMRNRYEELMKIMEAEKDRLEYGVLYRTQAWEGASMEAAVSGLKEFLEEGDYHLLYEQARGMRNCMDEILSEVDYLLGVQAGFPRQFQTNRYVQPYPEVRDRNAVLNGNYASLARGEMLCEDICEEAEEAGRRLRNLLTDYRDCLGDTQEEQYEAERAVARLLRVEHYRQALWEYRTRMQELDIHMGTKLWRLTAEIVPCQEAGISEEPEESVESVKELLLTKEGGAYVFEAYLTGEKECSPIEYEALASILVEKLETSEEESLYVQEAYLQSLFGEGTDREKVNELLKYVGNNGEARDTLIRMCNICAPKETDPAYEITVGVNHDYETSGLVTYLIHNIRSDAVDALVPRDMEELLTPYMEMREMPPYTGEDLKTWMSVIGNEEDWEMVYGLIQEDYESAFHADPNALGPGVTAILLSYEGEVFAQGPAERQEAFLNGILSHSGEVYDYNAGNMGIAVLDTNHYSEQYLYRFIETTVRTLGVYAQEEDLTVEEMLQMTEEYYAEHPTPFPGEVFGKLQLYKSLLNEQQSLLKEGEENTRLRVSFLQLNGNGFYEYHVDSLLQTMPDYLGGRIRETILNGKDIHTETYEYRDIEITWDEEWYEKAGNYLLLGTFYDGSSRIGTVIEFVIGILFPELGMAMTIRDIAGCLTNIFVKKENVVENWIALILNCAASFLPNSVIHAISKKVTPVIGKLLGCVQGNWIGKGIDTVAGCVDNVLGRAAAVTDNLRAKLDLEKLLELDEIDNLLTEKINDWWAIPDTGMKVDAAVKSPEKVANTPDMTPNMAEEAIDAADDISPHGKPVTDTIPEAGSDMADTPLQSVVQETGETVIKETAEETAETTVKETTETIAREARTDPILQPEPQPVPAVTEPAQPVIMAGGAETVVSAVIVKPVKVLDEAADEAADIAGTVAEEVMDAVDDIPITGASVTETITEAGSGMAENVDEVVESVVLGEGGLDAKPNMIGSLLDGRPELTGSTRDKLLSTIQDSELSKIVNELYRPGATVGDGGTAVILVEEFSNGSSTHLLKATERLKQLKKLASSGKLGLNDLDIVEALIDDLESAISLYD